MLLPYHCHNTPCRALILLASKRQACKLPVVTQRSSLTDWSQCVLDAVLSPSGQVTGCQVSTPRMQVTVYQVSGYEQALLHPEETWAAPYTW